MADEAGRGGGGAGARELELFRNLPLREGDGDGEREIGLERLIAASGGTGEISALRRLAVALERVSVALVILVVLMLIFVVGLLVTVTLTMTRVSDALGEISDAVSPSQVSAISTSLVEGSHMGAMSMQNLYEASEAGKELAFRTLGTLNETQGIIQHANVLLGELVEHPRMAVSFGDGAAAGAGAAGR